MNLTATDPDCRSMAKLHDPDESTMIAMTPNTIHVRARAANRPMTAIINIPA
jgi:hypothetical protein